MTTYPLGEFELAGIRSNNILESIDLKGYKPYELLDYLDVAGLKAFGFETEQPILAQKIIDLKKINT